MKTDVNVSTAKRTFSRTDQVITVLAQHSFETNALVAWLEEQISGFKGPIEVFQFQGGMSNPTFLINDKNVKSYSRNTIFFVAFFLYFFSE